MTARELVQDIARTTERCLQMHTDYHRQRPPGAPVLCPDCEDDAVKTYDAEFRAVFAPLTAFGQL